MLIPTFQNMPKSQKQIGVAKTETALVLIADDDVGMRRILRQLIEQEGFEVIEATNGHEALELYHQHSPNLVLLDAVMPVMDGFTCCRQLYNLHRVCPVPVLIVTVLDDENSIIRAFEAGAIDFVTKPIHPIILRQRLHRLIQQYHLMQQVQQMNHELNTYAEISNATIREKTAQLQRSLEFESTLKRITDHVRDSLDETVILQTAVQELCWALELGCCNAAIYNCEQRSSEVQYEYTASIPGYQHRILHTDDHPEIYQHLLQGEAVQFCTLPSQSWRGNVSLFAFAIKNGKTIGDLWLISYAERTLNDLEMRLVEQVANQCAIAIRQARLYQASQAQVKELERLDQLKDDFLSTVSHELRTPVTNMRVAIRLLEQQLESNQKELEDAAEPSVILNKSHSYLQILHQECDREINLINDLLDLQRLESGQQTFNLIALNLQDWLSPEIEVFTLRAQTRQQTFQVSLANSLPPIKIDPLCLQRILTELINNACKYSPSEAVITLTASRTEATPPTIRISVINTGVTIPEHELERIFDKFYRIPESDRWSQGGTGLGLALVKRLVERFDGSVQATSTVDQTCFTIELPIRGNGSFASIELKRVGPG